MSEIEELRAEMEALKTLLGILMRREWDKTNRDPHWPDNLRVYGIAEVEKYYAGVSAKDDIRAALVRIVTEALTRPLP